MKILPDFTRDIKKLESKYGMPYILDYMCTVAGVEENLAYNENRINDARFWKKAQKKLYKLADKWLDAISLSEEA